MIRFKQDKAMKIYRDLIDTSQKCKCGHTIHFLRNKVDYANCSWCGRRVYKTRKTEFIEKLKIELLKKKNRERNDEVLTR